MVYYYIPYLINMRIWHKIKHFPFSISVFSIESLFLSLLYVHINVFTLKHIRNEKKRMSTMMYEKVCILFCRSSTPFSNNIVYWIGKNSTTVFFCARLFHSMVFFAVCKRRFSDHLYFFFFETSSFILRNDLNQWRKKACG